MSSEIPERRGLEGPPDGGRHAGVREPDRYVASFPPILDGECRARGTTDGNDVVMAVNGIHSATANMKCCSVIITDNDMQYVVF